jgi:septum formation protein
MPQPPLLLASSSPYRAQILDRLGLAYEQASPDVDETERSGESPAALAQRLAEAKAQALAEQYPGYVIIGSDQVPALGTKVLRKPGNAENAYQQLFECSGQTVVFNTGLCVHDARTATTATQLVTTEVVFRPLSEAAIRRYIAIDQPFDSAGAFRSECLGMALFDRVTSDDPDALVGLPLITLNKMLLAVGIDALAA